MQRRNFVKATGSIVGLGVLGAPAAAHNHVELSGSGPDDVTEKGSSGDINWYVVDHFTPDGDHFDASDADAIHYVEGQRQGRFDITNPTVDDLWLVGPDNEDWQQHGPGNVIVDYEFDEANPVWTGTLRVKARFNRHGELVNLNGESY